MRHGKKFNSLSRKAEHRKALLSNLSKSLITHKRIQTTLAKAKALRKYIEPLITKSKYDSTHSRRTVFRYLGDKEAVKELFISVADKVGDRPGGYTRIIKMGTRPGDGAEKAMIELVDFNENLLEEKTKSSGRRRKRRRGGSGSSGSQASAQGNETENTEAQNPDDAGSGSEPASDRNQSDSSQDNGEDDQKS